MRIALLGTRGIPANYGGFETFAEEISVRLAERGHQVTVYCREKHPFSRYRGVDLRYLPAPQHKYLETIAHTALSTADLLFRRFDVILYCNAANALFTLWPRLLGVPTVLNVDGIERRRKKWNAVARSWYVLSEWLATWCCSAVVTDAETIRQYYLERFHKQSTFIPYGAATGKIPETDQVRALGLEPGRYVLYASRLEPENNALLVREAFEKVRNALQAGADRRCPLCRKLYTTSAANQRPAYPDPRRHLRGGLSSIAVPLRRLCTGHRSWRYPSGPHRSHGPRRFGALSSEPPKVTRWRRIPPRPSATI